MPLILTYSELLKIKFIRSGRANFSTNILEQSSFMVAFTRFICEIISWRVMNLPLISILRFETYIPLINSQLSLPGFVFATSHYDQKIWLQQQQALFYYSLSYLGNEQEG